MTDEQVMEMIKRHEGFRDRIYRDSVGVLTVGWGHALHEGSHVPVAICERLFESDFEKVKADYQSLGLDDLDPVRRGVLLDMLFNLGKPRLLGFRLMFMAIRKQDYVKAAEEMLDSKWAGQVGMRAVRLSRMMRTGQVE